MTRTIETLVLLLVVVAAVGIAAKRLKVPPAILLVLTGVVLALVPGLPAVSLAPEFVLLLVLPPIIYSSAVAMSWREFRFNLRPISLLAVGCVVFTNCRGRHRDALAPRHALVSGIRFGSDRFAARRCGAAFDRPQNAATQANPRRPGRRRSR